MKKYREGRGSTEEINNIMYSTSNEMVSKIVKSVNEEKDRDKTLIMCKLLVC